MHNAWVTMSGEKMSKSLGNSVLVSEMVKRWRPIVLRYYLGTPHYRSMIEYSEEALREAESAFARIEGFVQRVVEKAGEPVARRRARCRRRSPRRWTTTWACRRRWPSCTPPSGRATPRSPRTTRRPRSPALAEVRAMLGVLGLDPLDPQWAGGASADDDLHGVVDSLVRLVLEQRQAARARKDYATADAIRDQLQQSGLEIEDTPAGPRWSLGSR